MDPFTIILLLSSAVIGGILSTSTAERAKNEAKQSQATILGDLDAALATEKEKLATEYGETKTRVEQARDTVLGSQRQAFYLRGDVGGQDTAAAQVIASTGSRAQGDLDLLEQKYNLGIETLDKQTQLAKDQLDWEFKQYITGITAQHISDMGGILNTALTGLAGLDITGINNWLSNLFPQADKTKKINAKKALSSPILGGSTTESTNILPGDSLWNPMTGYPG